MDSSRKNSAINRAMQSNKVKDSAGRCLTWSTQIGTVFESTPLVCGRSSEKAINRWWGSAAVDHDGAPIPEPSSQMFSTAAPRSSAGAPPTGTQGSAVNLLDGDGTLSGSALFPPPPPDVTALREQVGDLTFDSDEEAEDEATLQALEMLREEEDERTGNNPTSTPAAEEKEEESTTGHTTK